MIERKPEAAPKLAQRPELIQLREAVEPVARGRPARHDEPKTLDVAQHPRAPTALFRRLADGEGLHRANLNRSMSRFGGALAPVSILESHDVVELRGRDLDDRRVLDRPPSMDGPGLAAEGGAG